ncbi:hypothetical protein G6F46_002674 [Rhizopus delemar]|uniref:Endonuclease/exonuclease/phosphatase domain-containing protein n=1 Tax=Rhizopus oryzae TaxID=64495 RepID=A0A9P6YJP5_RHIOR|nr:hypothetical protein G6F55_001650 [Rhizopus delemar]KAG1550199.1 hypothetical protein G6F51_002584 [Rhizopus arrhizus]KAG1502875.1 hypothetical protein G6F54_002050 [Rhizopus delemar]KAG1516330.1 hypothetical protein G6F53_002235 [Rhizopus delemar]KAG1528756.1 hypothetical protein G6F52_000360 [Rhizopus delemar]
MLNIVNSIQPAPANTHTSMNPEFSGSFQGATSSQVTKIDNSQTDSQSLLNMIQLLTKELASARTEIERLRVQTAYLQEQLNQQNNTSNPTNHLSSSEFPPLQNTATALLSSTLWHQPEKLQVPVGQIRSHLRKLDINNNRIIDIHYHDRNIVALLIHNDYEDELRQQLQRFKVTIKEDFNPCDHEVLRDPKYADCTPAEREDLAFMHHCNRIERAPQYIRTPVKFAVARLHMSPITITLFNATGLAKQAISPILHLAQFSSVLLITETWLLPPNKYPTHWKQFHTYGIKLQPLATKGHQGISLLINPICPYHVHYLPNDDDMSISQYKLSFIIADTLVHCVYLPPSLDNQVVSQVLDSLPHTAPDVKHTILCGGFNARIGPYTGDSSTNPRGTTIYRWLQERNFILWNQRLAYGKPTFIAHQGSSMIDFFMSDTELCNPSLTIREDLSLDSAHKIMSFSYHPNILPETHSQQPRTTWKLTKLQDSKTRNQYIQSFQNAANNISMSIENNKQQPHNQQSARDFIEKLNDVIFQAIYISLDNICRCICQQTDPLENF